jgi:hypothetical protein
MRRPRQRFHDIADRASSFLEPLDLWRAVSIKPGEHHLAAGGARQPGGELVAVLLTRPA